MAENLSDDPQRTDQSKKRRRIIIFFAALLALSAVVWGIVAWIQNDAARNKPPQRVYNYIAPSREDCLKMKNSEDADFCLDRVIAAEAVNNGDFYRCAEIKDEWVRDDCRLAVARNLGDEKLCEIMGSKFGKTRCLSIVGIVKKDTAVCDLFGDGEPYEKQECVDRVMAFIIAEDGDKETISKCADLKTLEYEKLCLMNSYENKFGGDCAAVPQAFRQYCLAQAIISGDPNFDDCNEIDMKNDRDTNNYRNFCYKVAQMGHIEAAKVDSDGDGVNDANELFMNLDPYNADVDGDGLTDGEEWIVYGTNPASRDSDGDGTGDYEQAMTEKSSAGGE